MNTTLDGRAARRPHLTARVTRLEHDEVLPLRCNIGSMDVHLALNVAEAVERSECVLGAAVREVGKEMGQDRSRKPRADHRQALHRRHDDRNRTADQLVLRVPPVDGITTLT